MKSTGFWMRGSTEFLEFVVAGLSTEFLGLSTEFLSKSIYRILDFFAAGFGKKRGFQARFSLKEDEYGC